jgi:hypothetical protein
MAGIPNRMGADFLTTTIQENAMLCLKRKFHSEFPEKNSMQIEAAIRKARAHTSQSDGGETMEDLVRAQLSGENW